MERLKKSFLFCQSLSQFQRPHFAIRSSFIEPSKKKKKNIFRTYKEKSFKSHPKKKKIQHSENFFFFSYDKFHICMVEHNKYSTCWTLCSE